MAWCCVGDRTRAGLPADLPVDRRSSASRVSFGTSVAGHQFSWPLADSVDVPAPGSAPKQHLPRIQHHPTKAFTRKGWRGDAASKGEGTSHIGQCRKLRFGRCPIARAITAQQSPHSVWECPVVAFVRREVPLGGTLPRSGARHAEASAPRQPNSGGRPRPAASPAPRPHRPPPRRPRRRAPTRKRASGRSRSPDRRLPRGESARRSAC